MTGLDIENDHIIEIFCLITDGDLNLVEPEGWGAVIHVPHERMALMDPWCTKTHGESGLTAAVSRSTTTPQEAADGMLAYIKKYIPRPRTALLAGNSVHVDRNFLQRGPYKDVIDHLHYRIFDVSTIKEAARRWSSDDVFGRVPAKQCLHQARDDILESIAEARYYRDIIFAPPSKKPSS
jgi:oligoribonuclease